MASTTVLRVDETDRRLEELGIQLPAAPTLFGTYVETLQTGQLSGTGPRAACARRLGGEEVAVPESSSVCQRGRGAQF